MHSATSFSQNTLVVSDDPAFAQHLRSILEQDHRRNVEVASSFQEAESLVERQVPETVFIDFRQTPSGGDDTRTAPSPSVASSGGAPSANVVPRCRQHSAHREISPARRHSFRTIVCIVSIDSPPEFTV